MIIGLIGMILGEQSIQEGLKGRDLLRSELQLGSFGERRSVVEFGDLLQRTLDRGSKLGEGERGDGEGSESGSVSLHVHRMELRQILQLVAVSARELVNFSSILPELEVRNALNVHSHRQALIGVNVDLCKSDASLVLFGELIDQRGDGLAFKEAELVTIPLKMEDFMSIEDVQGPHQEAVKSTTTTPLGAVVRA